MSQRRMIYSSIWSNEDFGDIAERIIDKLRRRIIFIGTISLADDDGRLNGSAKFIKASIFPYDEVDVKDIENDLNVMSSKEILYRYKVNDKYYIEHRNWDRWQKIRKDMYKKSDIPAKENGEVVKESKKIVKVNDTEPPKVYGDPKINELLEFGKMFNFPFQGTKQKNRFSASNMIKKYGLDKSKNLVKAAVACQGKQYAPTICSFDELYRKVGTLVVYYRRKDGGEEEIPTI